MLCNFRNFALKWSFLLFYEKIDFEVGVILKAYSQVQHLVLVLPNPFRRGGGSVEKLHGDPTVGPRPKVWTRDQKWKKYCQRWHAGETRMWDSPGGGGVQHLGCNVAKKTLYFWSKNPKVKIIVLQTPNQTGTIQRTSIPGIKSRWNFFEQLKRKSTHKKSNLYYIRLKARCSAFQCRL